MLTVFDHEIGEWVVTSSLTQRKFYGETMEKARKICEEDDRIYTRHHRYDNISDDQETI